MLEDWIVVTIGVVVIIVAICGTYLLLSRREMEMVRNRHKLAIYEELFQAITELNTAGHDEYRLNRAKLHLAFILNRINLNAGPGVLSRVNELLDFLNECTDNDYDVLKQLNILNSIVRAVREEVDPDNIRALEESNFRFRFFSPPRI